VKTILASLILASALAAQTGLAPVPGDCASSADVARLQNIGSLEFSVTLDRGEYLSFEVMTMTVSLRNTSGQSIEIYDPWQPYGIGLAIARLKGADQDPGNPNRLQYSSRRVFAGVWGGCGGAGIWLQPGETLTRQIRSDQPLPDLTGPALADYGAAVAPGSYQLAVSYRNHVFTAPFQVVEPEVESFVGLQLAGQSLYGYVIRVGQSRYLTVDAHPRARLPLAAGEQPALAAHVRVAELGADDSLVALEASGPDRYTATLRSAQGTRTIGLNREPGGL
jgi:hypothetical protein